MLGVDVPPTSAAKLAAEIDKKTGVFCAFFDTGCLRREDTIARRNAGVPPSSEPLYSYRERLVTGSVEGIRVGVSDHPRMGTVTVTFSKEGKGFGPVEFDFLVEGGEWKLSGVPEY